LSAKPRCCVPRWTQPAISHLLTMFGCTVRRPWGTIV
jgi:hypothetical protein